ncbi:unnamed protein product, partial [Didymodactylos carnosus]
MPKKTIKYVPQPINNPNAQVKTATYLKDRNSDVQYTEPVEIHVSPPPQSTPSPVINQSLISSSREVVSPAEGVRTTPVEWVQTTTEKELQTAPARLAQTTRGKELQTAPVQWVQTTPPQWTQTTPAKGLQNQKETNSRGTS